jgi:hypothetical protein
VAFVHVIVLLVLWFGKRKGHLELITDQAGMCLSRLLIESMASDYLTATDWGKFEWGTVPVEKVDHLIELLVGFFETKAKV